MKVISAVCFLIGFVAVYGNPCMNIAGVWINERGANITVVQTEDLGLSFHGLYKEKTFEGVQMRGNLTGLIKPVEDGGSLIAFNAILNKGLATAAWVGQCMVCDGQERIFATWVQQKWRNQSTTILYDKQMSTTVNQTTFWKVEPTDEEQQNEESSAEGPLIDVDIRGAWTSKTGDGLNITNVIPHGIVLGDHLTPNENPIPLFGLNDGNAAYIALGFVSAGSTRIKGWAGYIHNPKPTDNVMETSWLSHGFINSCNDPRDDVEIGVDNYSPVLSGAS